MKNLFLLLCFFITLKFQSQTFTYCPGDSVYLGLPSYTGTLQWQESTDSLNWSNIPGANFSPYGFLFSGNKYYRAMVTNTNCNPVYSPVQLAANKPNCQPQYSAGSVFCNVPTAIVDVTNPTTGKNWMDRNLGASQVATSSTDANAYGDLYQWGRRSDGHQCRTSLTTTTLSSSQQPNHGDFILTSNTPLDWLNPQNNNLWQGQGGLNNPCPTGYRLPTEAESNSERSSWGSNNSAGAFSALLKFSVGGYRNLLSGLVVDAGSGGNYWTSTINSTASRSMDFSSTNANIYNINRGSGRSVRCIKEVATVGSLGCNNYILIGNLISGLSASSVTVSVPYTGGNGGCISTQSFSSTGVTGLTATLTSGVINSGSGTLTFNITGTPTTSGTASFTISVGGQSCTFTITVQPAVYPSGSVFCNGPTAIVDVTNPNTGKTWMDRNLGATQVATSSTDANSYGDLYQWGRGSDGHQCRTSATTSTLSITDQPLNSSFIIINSGNFDWRSPQNTNLWQGVNGVNNPCPIGYRLPTETELTAEHTGWSSQNSVGAFASPLKLPLAGGRDNSSGSLGMVGTYGVYWSSAVSPTNSRSLFFDSSNANINNYYRASGFSVRCIKETVGSVGAINCGGATTTGNLYANSTASGVTVTVPYTGGNGGYYSSQNLASSGITGLTASLTQGLLASGSGSLTYSITGTPSGSGTASFAIAVGGQGCTFTVNVSPGYPAGSVFCNGPTAIVDVTNPNTGKTWMDRNLGASQVATSSIDVNAYGDLYQWGRRSDGHQCRTSPTNTTLSSNDQPSNGNFILTSSSPNDWRSPQNSNLWQGINGINNPCPSGYRLPTDAELDAQERPSWNTYNSSGAFNSPLKWTVAGYRNFSSGTLTNVGSSGYYWSRTIASLGATYLVFNSSSAGNASNNRANGMSVRCIKE
ncbi:MAG: hypothetical protein ACK5D5_05410 [Bacteroidota bacterium]